MLDIAWTRYIQVEFYRKVEYYPYVISKSVEALIIISAISLTF
jgi:hypothetical protein